MGDSLADSLFFWFQSQNGIVDASSMGFKDFSDSGRGAVALRDIPVSSWGEFIGLGSDVSPHVCGTTGRPYVVLNTSRTHTLRTNIVLTGAFGKEFVEKISTRKGLGWSYIVHDVGGVSWAGFALVHLPEYASRIFFATGWRVYVSIPNSYTSWELWHAHVLEWWRY